MFIFKKDVSKLFLSIAASIASIIPVLAQVKVDTSADSAWRVSAAYHPKFVRTEIAYESKPFWRTTFLNKPLDARYDASLAYWHATHTIHTRNSHSSLWQVGMTPMIRWWLGECWYLEGGIGATLMNHTRFSNKEFSTAFQFGNHLGIGWAMTDQWRLGLRYSHFSNASIKTPNPGFDMLSLTLSRTF